MCRSPPGEGKAREAATAARGCGCRVGLRVPCGKAVPRRLAGDMRKRRRAQAAGPEACGL